MENRLVELETRIAYQDRHIAELDEVVRLFSARVERLEHWLQEVRATVLHGADPIGGGDEPPPHY